SFEWEVHRLALFGTDGHLHILRRVLFMPGLERIRTGRQTLDGEGAVVSGHRKERMIHNTDVRPHPGMYVALHRDHDFFASEALQFIFAFWRLRFVPLLID